MTQWPSQLYRAASVLLALVLSACGGAGQLQVQEAQVRAPVPGALATAGYMRLDNSTRQAWDLVAVEVQGFGRVEMHETVQEDGMSRMRARESVRIPARGQVLFEPGGLHLMLMQPAPDLSGETALIGTLQLRAEDGSRRAMPVEFSWMGLPSPAAADAHQQHQAP